MDATLMDPEGINIVCGAISIYFPDVWYRSLLLDLDVDVDPSIFKNSTS